MTAAAPSVCVFDVNETLIDIEFIAHCSNDYLAIAKPYANGSDNSSSIPKQ
jgi:hypothetical protein